MSGYVSNYIPGDFKRICDRCGSVFHASQTFRTWDGLYVCREDWEPRHPQDFVRGRLDNQNVPNPRPEPLETIVGPLTTTIAAAALAGATTINVASSVRFMVTDRIGVITDNGSTRENIIFNVPNTTSIQLTTPLHDSVSVGNLVIDYSAVSQPDIG